MSKATRRLSWALPETPLPAHPIRDTLLVYGGLAVFVVVAAWLTGGSLPKAIVVALAFYAVASVWSVWRIRSRLAREARLRSAAEREGV